MQGRPRSGFASDATLQVKLSDGRAANDGVHTVPDEPNSPVTVDPTHFSEQQQQRQQIGDVTTKTQKQQQAKPGSSLKAALAKEQGQQQPQLARDQQQKSTHKRQQSTSQLDRRQQLSVKMQKQKIAKEGHRQQQLAGRIDSFVIGKKGTGSKKSRPSEQSPAAITNTKTVTTEGFKSEHRKVNASPLFRQSSSREDERVPKTAATSRKSIPEKPQESAVGATSKHRRKTLAIGEPASTSELPSHSIQQQQQQQQQQQPPPQKKSTQAPNRQSAKHKRATMSMRDETDSQEHQRSSESPTQHVTDKTPFSAPQHEEHAMSIASFVSQPMNRRASSSPPRRNTLTNNNTKKNNFEEAIAEYDHSTGNLSMGKELGRKSKSTTQSAAIKATTKAGITMTRRGLFDQNPFNVAASIPQANPQDSSNRAARKPRPTRSQKGKDSLKTKEISPDENKMKGQVSSLKVALMATKEQESDRKTRTSTPKQSRTKELETPGSTASRVRLPPSNRIRKAKSRIPFQSPVAAAKPKVSAKQFCKPPQTNHMLQQSAPQKFTAQKEINDSNWKLRRQSHDSKGKNPSPRRVHVRSSITTSDLSQKSQRDARKSLGIRLERQKLPQESHFCNTASGDVASAETSDGSLALISKTESLSSSVHGHMLTLKRAKAGRVSIALAGKNGDGLNLNTTHVSSNAGNIAENHLTPRPSFAANLLTSAGGGKEALLPKSHSLTFFGNPMVPIDVVGQTNRTSKLNLMHHKDALQVLGKIKHMKRRQLLVKPEGVNASTALLPVEGRLNGSLPKETQPELKAIQLLKTAGTASSATLSMTGFKGGTLESQVNHDRSLIVSPFYLRNQGNAKVRRRLMGVFDGHAEHGCRFAEHCQLLLPNLLSQNLSEAFKRAVDSIAAGMKTGEDEVAITKRVLIESFLSLDESCPALSSGGCTATVVYQQGQKVFVANTGDSRSFIVVHRKNESTLLLSEGKRTSTMESTFSGEHISLSKSVKVVYISREDKPDIPEERARLEGWGGEIIPGEKHKSARVKFHGIRLGKASATLSMSRSIGDNQFTTLGVIPDPLVDVIDLKDVVEQEKKSGTPSLTADAADDVSVFAVCVSDGMMVETLEDAALLASELAPSLFNDDGPHPLTACQLAIEKTAAAWEKRNKGKFRDDITVATTVLRTAQTR